MKTTNNKTGMIATAVVLAVLLAACIAVDAALPSYHIAITVIKKATVYALVAVSMAASALLTFLCHRFEWTFFTEGFRTVALSVVLPLLFAWLFPVREEKEETP